MVTPPRRPRLQLEDLLLRHGAISAEQLAEAREDQKQLGGDVGRILVDKGFLSEELLLRALAHQLTIPLVDPEEVDIATELLQAVPVQVCERFGVIAVARDPSGGLRVATADPGNGEHLRQVEQYVGQRLLPAAATAGSIERAIRHHYYGEPRSKQASRPGKRPPAAAPARQPQRTSAPAAPPPAQASAPRRSYAEGAPLPGAQQAAPPPSAPPQPVSAAALLRPPGMRATLPPDLDPSLIAPEAEPQAHAEEDLPEAALIPDGPVDAGTVAMLEERIARLEAFVTQPQFAAALARVERLEQIAAQLAQAVRVIGGVIVDHELISLDEYKKRTGLR
jgi:hypothetical protein